MDDPISPEPMCTGGKCEREGVACSAGMGETGRWRDVSAPAVCGLDFLAVDLAVVRVAFWSSSSMLWFAVLTKLVCHFHGDGYWSRDDVVRKHDGRARGDGVINMQNPHVQSFEKLEIQPYHRHSLAYQHKSHSLRPA